MIHFVTYRQHGNLKRAVIDTDQYEKLSKNPSVSELVMYANQSLMEVGFNEIKGSPISQRRLLKG